MDDDDPRDDPDQFECDDLTALDFSSTADDEPASSLDALDIYGAEHGEVDNAEPTPLISASNPTGTVNVQAYLNGLTHRVELAPGTATMSETQLAEEICVIADVAAKKATSALYFVMAEVLTAQGIPRETAETFLQNNMPYATPPQARAAEVALAARYASGQE